MEEGKGGHNGTRLNTTTRPDYTHVNNHQEIEKMDFLNGAQANYTNMGVGNPNLWSKIASNDEID